MARKDNTVLELRKRAEALIDDIPNADKLKVEDLHQLVHELQVHQIELELQNEELRQTQAKLEENRTRYMKLYHNAPVGYVVLNKSGIIRESNATFARMTGVESPQIDGRPFTDFLVSDDQAIFRARLRSFFKHPVDKHIELQLQSAGNIPRYVDFAATMQNKQETSEEIDNELLITVTDVTARVEAQNFLQQSQDFIVAVLDSLDSHICVLDDNGTILLANKAWKQFAAENSTSPEDNLTEGANYLAACEQAQGEDMECARFFAAGIREILGDERETCTLEYPCHSPEEQRWFIGTATKLVSNIVYGKVVVAHQNITERKQLEKEQLYLHNQLKQIAKAESLGVMAGAVAHNFNNILGAVVGNLELAMHFQQDREKVAPMIKNALSAAWKASEISSLMLTYLGQKVSDRQVADFSSICNQNFQQIILAKPSEITITTDFPSPGPCARIDSKQIQQIVSNLIINGWEAMNKKPGSIHLAISIVHSSEIGDKYRFPLGWQPLDKNYACLSVQDDGCGITDEDIEKIFDPFYTSKFTGRGMGLSVILGIVRSHEGAITVESQIDEGTFFRVYVPVCSP
jgi:PAS domain S-box-containing protein